MQTSAKLTFPLLWVGESVSEFGSAVTTVAMPLLAVESLRASTLEVGVLNAVIWLPGLLVGLQAGVWVSRWRKRRTLVTTSISRGVLLASIPVLGLAGTLKLPDLIIVSFAVGSLNVFYDIAFQGFLPSVVDRKFLVKANGRLQTSYSAARIGGPGLAGLLIQAIGASPTIFVDAASFLFSAACASLLRVPEQKRPRKAVTTRLMPEIRDGIRFTFEPGPMRTLTVAAMITNFSLSGYTALRIVFLVRDLGLSARSVGALLAVSGIGGLVGAFLAPSLGRRFGTARVAVATPVVMAAGGLAIPLASTEFAAVMFGFGAMLLTFGASIFNVQVRTFRQAYCPPEMLARLIATVRFVILGTMPLGSLLGGITGQFLGNRPALWLFMLLNVVPAVMVVASPLSRQRELIPESR